MGKRKRSTVKKSRSAIMKTADSLQKAGIDVDSRGLMVGGQQPKPVWKERRDRESHDPHKQ